MVLLKQWEIKIFRKKQLCSQTLDELSTAIRPNIKYKTERPDLDGGAIDIHKVIGKLPKPKSGWTPSDYKYMGPNNPLDKQLKYDPNKG